MRRLVSAALAAALLAAPSIGLAQYPGGGGRQEQGRDREQQERDKERQRREWEGNRLRLPGDRNRVGPCPFVKVLYDAARYVEFSGDAETAGDVSWTGEIQGVEADCRYRDDDPIRVEVDVLFAFGKGPKAEGDSRTYRYWVAVTERNRLILAKEYFDIGAEFDPGQDRVAYRERIDGIVIPRATATVSGAAFEILVGFDVTPEMAEFNRAGKRFRIDVAPQASGAATTQ